MGHYPNLYRAVKLAINMTDPGNAGYKAPAARPAAPLQPRPAAPAPAPATGRMLGPVADEVADWRTPMRLPDLPRPQPQYPRSAGPGPQAYAARLDTDDVTLANLARDIARQTQRQHGLRVGRGNFTDVRQAANFLRQNPRFMEAARRQFAARHPARVIQD